MPAKPMHGGIISEERRNPSLSFVIFDLTFPPRRRSAGHLSTCAAVAALISERGRKDRQLNEQHAERGVVKQFTT